jgi:hypothetical protein
MTVQTQLQGAILTLAVSLGVLGNIFVVVCICRRRKLLKNNHYYLILQLAICDLFFLLFHASDIYSVFSVNPFIASRLMCTMWRPVHTIFYTAGINFLVLISVIRYRAIVQPLKPTVSRGTLKILSTFVYVLALICIIPQVLVLRYNKTCACHEEWPMESLNIAYTIFLMCVQYFVPVLFLTTIYYKICKQLVTRNNWIHRLNVGNQMRPENDRAPTWFQCVNRRSTKTFLVCFTIVTCFILSACPIQVAWIVSVTGSKELSSYFFWFNALNIFGTAVINPYVYGALDNKVFSLFKHCRKNTFHCFD